MADRSLYSETSSPMPTGLEFLDQYADRLGQLFTAAIWPLSSVGGTGNAVTATCDPPLLAGLVQHMRFAITWAATNTSGVTLSVGGGTPVPVLAADGSALIAGDALAGSRALLEYVGGAFLVIGSSAANDNAAPYFLQITTSMTWNKVAGFADDAVVTFEGWGAGKGGGRSQSGGTGQGGTGGTYVRREFRYAEVPSSLSMTIGAGGPGATTIANGTNGGSTSIGSLLTAPGGGQTTQSRYSGTLWAPGLAAVFAGADGGSTVSGTFNSGGTSVFGGNGGDSGGTGPSLGTPTAGIAPGGGGGGSSGGGTNSVPGAAGARGEVRIWIAA